MVFTALAPLLVFSSARAFAHEFETGHIERSIDVVIRDRHVQVKYAIGLSDTTILDRLAEKGLIESSEEARFRKCIADLEFQAVKEESNNAKGGENGIKTSESKSPSRPAPETLSTRSTIAKTSADTSESDSVAEPLEFQTELLTLLQDKLSDSIIENLKLEYDGNSLIKTEIAVSNSPRHHVSLEIAFSVDLPDAEKNELVFVDRNFLDLMILPAGDKPKPTLAKNDQDVDDQELRYFGNIRLACRVKGKVVQLKSNVAPVLARSTLISVGSLNRQQRVEAATIRTKLAFPKSDKP